MSARAGTAEGDGYVRLVASLIVKNELGRYLEPCIEHLLTYCNEVRVLDDGSDDGTFEWLRKQRRVDVAPNPGPSFYEHEGQARQHLYDYTLEADPDYVLAIDTDELVGDPKLLRQACQRGLPVFTLSLAEVWHADPEGLQVRIDGLWKPRTVPILYKPKPEWRIRDRKLACGREPQEVVKLAGRSPATGSSVLHFGWTRQSEREARAARYDVHDAGRFHQDRHLQSILWEEQHDRRLRLLAQRWPMGLQGMAIALSERTQG
jgi:glycosyltransferase involved in cell wall biosynthesis